MVPIANGLNYVSLFILSVIAKLLIYNTRVAWHVYGLGLHASTANVTTLRLVHMLYRHGDRSSTHNYPTDNHTEDEWPQGYGQLSQIGMRQHYELGKFVRHRYQGFLSDRYNRSEIHIRSTDFDRTLMSAYSHLAGLFPPKGKQKWNDSIHWQPIPVHTVPQLEDDLMLIENNCPVFNKIAEEFQDSEIMKNINKKYKTFIEYVANHSGVAADFSSVASVYDIVFCEINHNMSQPSWVLAKGTVEKLQQFLILSHNFSYSKTARRLIGGPILKEFIGHMNNYTKGNTNMTEKFFMYSAHDSTVIRLMKVLNVYYDSPNYTAMVIIELHEKSPQHFFVEVYFKNGEKDPHLHLLTIPGCNSSCPLSDFLYLTKDSIPVDIKKECGIEEPIIQAKSLLAGVLIGCLVALIIVMFGIIGVIYCKFRRREKLRYDPLATDTLDDDDDEI